MIGPVTTKRNGPRDTGYTRKSDPLNMDARSRYFCLQPVLHLQCVPAERTKPQRRSSEERASDHSQISIYLASVLHGIHEPLVGLREV